MEDFCRKLVYRVFLERFWVFLMHSRAGLLTDIMPLPCLSTTIVHMNRVNIVFPAWFREHILFIDWTHGSPVVPVERNWTVFAIFIIFVIGTGQIAARPTEGVGFGGRQWAREGSWIPDSLNNHVLPSFRSSEGWGVCEVLQKEYVATLNFIWWKMHIHVYFAVISWFSKTLC